MVNQSSLCTRLVCVPDSYPYIHPHRFGWKLVMLITFFPLILYSMFKDFRVCEFLFTSYRSVRFPQWTWESDWAAGREWWLHILCMRRSWNKLKSICICSRFASLRFPQQERCIEVFGLWLFADFTSCRFVRLRMI